MQLESSHHCQRLPHAQPSSPGNETFFGIFFQHLSAVCHVPKGSGRTLRETVLESSPVLALLNQSFISSWSLVKELENMQVSRAVAQEMKPRETSYSIYLNLVHLLFNRLMSRTVHWAKRPVCTWRATTSLWR